MYTNLGPFFVLEKIAGQNCDSEDTEIYMNSFTREQELIFLDHI